MDQLKTCECCKKTAYAYGFSSLHDKSLDKWHYLCQECTNQFHRFLDCHRSKLSKMFVENSYVSLEKLDGISEEELQFLLKCKENAILEKFHH